MSMLPDVYICTLRKTNAPILPEGTAKCTHLAPQKFTGDAILDKKRCYCQSKSFSGKSGSRYSRMNQVKVVEDSL